MVILNTTFAVDATATGPVLEWIRGTYRPAAEQAAAGPVMLLRVLSPVNEGVESYALQTPFDDAEAAALWDSGAGAALRGRMREFFDDTALAFVTILETL